MQIMTETKREITIQTWEEQIEKYMKRLNDSMECFRQFHGVDDLTDMLEDIENLTETVKKCHKALNYMNLWGIN